MRILAVLLATTLLTAACGDDDGDTAMSTTTSRTPTTTTTGGDATTTTAARSPQLLPLGELEPVVGDLSVPWGVAFVDESTFLVTERTGVVRVVEDGRLRAEPVLDLDAEDRGEGGALGLALHPDFPEVRSAYLYYTASDGNRVSRFDVAEDLTMSGEQPLLEGIPAAPIHDGGRIAFGPDGHLYVTTGDASQPELAPDLDSLAGKILRIAADGSIPADNPFDGSPVWSYGHRNPQGLAWTDDATLYATEHGPSGEFGLGALDEINRIRAGGFYGWPYLASTTDTGFGGEAPADPIPPVASSGDDTWAPSGMGVVPGDHGPVLLVAALAAEALLRFDVTGDGVEAQGVAAEGFGRLRIADVGPDGCLYVGTSNTDGRGDPAADDDRILRSCA